MSDQGQLASMLEYPNSNYKWTDPPDPDKFNVCVHCGLCLDACPTYQETGNEAQSPRGRVYLIKSVAEGKLEINESFIDPVFRCLDCRACETACPSGVQVGALIEEARGQIRQSEPLTGLKGFVSDTFLKKIFPYPNRLRTIGKLTRFYQKSGLQKLARGMGVMNLFPRHLREMEAAMPNLPAKSSREALPSLIPAIGQKRGTVGLVLGCVMDVMFADINMATARVLARNGFDVVVPQAQGCCGALQVHAGERDTAKQMARQNIDTFLAAGVDYIIMNAAGCGAAVKEYPELLHSDQAYLEKAKQFAAKVRDISEFLVEVGYEPPKGRVEVKITYHDACHLAHAQNVRMQPRQILKSIPGVELIEMRESDRCCGSAGIYNLTHPEIASPLLDRKMADVPEGVNCITMGNPGCMMQIQVGVNRINAEMEVAHTVTLLDRAYQAEAESVANAKQTVEAARGREGA
ncbi:(Fe-S)-binding protein [Effusibacillus lacus]|uniref:Glycolate oxidase iron-sulfur subunit n=1 Tax=Effusibacillus lacus TaxID=1348429 RepID=A0A292YDF9_9BACL|nr:(Fe-S)-binding protein [Effusibacillus lacus]TCS71595.1 glycolate oxidase iron-sulfur subunit [Effusibacillus lacus]GAX90102.1 glycolate oxidase [Effusibacillus lacus]